MVAEWFSAPHSSCGPMGSNPIHGINSEALSPPCPGVGQGILREGWIREEQASWTAFSAVFQAGMGILL